MKKIFAVMVSLIFFCGFSAYAAPIIIKGKPTVLTQNPDGVTWVYSGDTLPVVGDNYYFVKMGDVSRVCSVAPISAVSVDGMPVSVQVGGTTSSYYCYDTNPAYFQVENDDD